MLNYDKILNTSPYSMNKVDKTKLLDNKLKQLTMYHYYNCEKNKSMLDSINFDIDKVKDFTDLPYLSVSFFGKMDLLSIDKGDVFKIITFSDRNSIAVINSMMYLTESDKEDIIRIIMEKNYWDQIG